MTLMLNSECLLAASCQFVHRHFNHKTTHRRHMCVDNSLVVVQMMFYGLHSLAFSSHTFFFVVFNV